MYITPRPRARRVNTWKETWWRRGELNGFSPPTPRKLFIRHYSESSKSSQKAQRRYTNAIRRPSLPTDLNRITTGVHRSSDMRPPVVEILSEGRANVYFKKRLWKREGYPVLGWKKVEWQPKGFELRPTSRTGAKVLEEVYEEESNSSFRLRRFPRLGIPDEITGFYEIPQLCQLTDESLTWSVHGMIPRGSITLLTGPPGGYKTWLALVLAKSVSEGTQFLGLGTLKTPVLYLDNENPSTVIRDRQRILNLSDGYFLKLLGDLVGRRSAPDRRSTPARDCP